jgi:hypothetical protein
VNARSIARTLLLVVLLLAALTARVVFEGERQIRQSTEALEAGDAETAIFHARAAALWFAPGAPHVRVAYGRLMALGKEAEERKLWDTALSAYRGVISASASTRWLARPHADDASLAEAAVERIETRKRAGAAAEPGESLTASPSAPDTLTTRVFLVAGFLGTVAGLSLLLLRGVDETGRLLGQKALPGILVSLLGLALYVVSLFLA